MIRRQINCKCGLRLDEKTVFHQREAVQSVRPRQTLYRQAGLQLSLTIEFAPISAVALWDVNDVP